MKTRNMYSTEIAEAIKAFLTEDGWNFTFDEEKGKFEFGVRLECRIRDLKFRVKVKSHAYSVYLFSPIGPDEDDREIMLRMADFICRCNFGLSYGHFDLDMRDGEIRYKYSVDCDGIVLSKEIIENSVHRPCDMFMRYSEGILSILFNNADPEKAYKQCEEEHFKEMVSLLDELAHSDENPEARELLAEMNEVSDENGSGTVEETEAADTYIKPNLFGSEGEEDEG